MQAVILTIVFLAGPAGEQQSTQMEVRDLQTCESLAENWRRWPGGLLRVMSATCRTRGGDAAAPAASASSTGARVARN